MMRWFSIIGVCIVVVAGLGAACGPAHIHDIGGPVPIAGDAEPRATELFLVLDLDGEYYIQIDTPAMEGLVDPVADVTTVEMVSESEAWAFLGTLSAPAAYRVHKALAGLGPIQVMDGGHPAEDVFFGAPVLVGRVVPHFGEVAEMEEKGIFIDDEDQGALRKTFLAGTAPVILIPIQGELYDSMTTWARTRSDHQPKVAIFDEGPLGPRDDEAADVAAAMPAWTAAAKRVDLAYQGKDLGDPPYLDETTWTACYLNEEDEPVGDPWIYYFLHYGETFCGEGPDEARLASLWAPKSPLDKPLAFVTEDGASLVIEPHLIGDLDGDGAVEMVGLVDDLTGEIQILRVKDGALETLKSAKPIYRDCPC
jgi:hypothetical protein